MEPGKPNHLIILNTDSTRLQIDILQAAEWLEVKDNDGMDKVCFKLGYARAYLELLGRMISVEEKSSGEESQNE